MQIGVHLKLNLVQDLSMMGGYGWFRILFVNLFFYYYK